MPDRKALDELLAYVKADNRICPQPQLWNKLWQILPDRKRVGVGWEPSAPLILAAWYEATDDQKSARLAEHVNWAHKHGQLEPIDTFLRALPEDDWYHIGG